SLWQMAERIHAANPAAFIRNDPDLIREGSEIHVPAGGAATAPTPVTAAMTDRPATPVPAARPLVHENPLARENPVGRANATSQGASPSLANAAAGRPDTAAVISDVAEAKPEVTAAPGASATA